MIRRLRDAFRGGTSRQATDAAVGHGMADVLAALDNVIDDDAALGRIYAGIGKNVPCAAPGRTATAAAGEASPPAGLPESAAAPAGAREPAAARRRLALLPVAAVAAVLTAGAVLLAAIGMPGTRRGGTEGPAVNTAYVVKRVDSALDAAGPVAIAEMTITTSSAATAGGQTLATTAKEWSYGDQWRAVTYSAAGQLVYDEGSSSASVYTVVSYQARTWARQPRLGGPAALAPGARGCGPLVAALPLPFQPGLPVPGVAASSLPATVARALRAAVSCGALTATGRQRVDGIEAIELTSRQDSVIPETIWVSPGTYLPLRVVIDPAPGQPGPRQTADITWLPPTAQNLNKLAVPIPAGFRQVPLAQAVRPLMRRVQG
jgi:hypothetical protein